MKIGYPCINWTIGCKGNLTFRLKSYSEEKLIETVNNNLSCLVQMLNFNADKNLLFFRITSDLVPFASHPICKFNWQKFFKDKFEEIGEIIKNNNMRISMHPDQFIVINSKTDDIVKRSTSELNYHSDVLDLLKLDNTAKIQLHIGGAYDNKIDSMNRFIVNYKKLNDNIKNRLIIENDNRIYSFNNCLSIHEKTKIPILFDVFHHSILNNNEKIKDILEKQVKTWRKNDGIPMVDYSSQKPGFKLGSHSESIDIKDFQRFLKQSNPYNFDIMLEIKDKETSALKTLEILKKDKRFIPKSG